MPAVTRLGLGGFTRGLYGSFAGKVVAVVPSAATIYAFDMDDKTFWPMSLGNEDHDPFAVIQFEPLGDADKGDVIWGCRDGRPRQFDNTTFQDDGTNVSSYVVIGPVKLGDVNEGIIQRLYGTVVVASGDITWEVYTGKNEEDSINTSGTPKATGTWVAGLNSTDRPRSRGVAFSLKLIGAESNDGWNVEEVDVVTLEQGRRRV